MIFHDQTLLLIILPNENNIPYKTVSVAISWQVIGWENTLTIGRKVVDFQTQIKTVIAPNTINIPNFKFNLN